MLFITYQYFLVFLYWTKLLASEANYNFSVSLILRQNLLTPTIAFDLTNLHHVLNISVLSFLEHDCISLIKFPLLSQGLMRLTSPQIFPKPCLLPKSHGFLRFLNSFSYYSQYNLIPKGTLFYVVYYCFLHVNICSQIKYRLLERWDHDILLLTPRILRAENVVTNKKLLD